jgi:saccharopine dehydrogenase-like NADP-dependent oxidoreductase
MAAMKKVLLLGAGLVTRPLTRFLLDRGDIELTVASRTVSKAEALIEGRKNGKAVPFDITREESKLEDLVKASDLAISLLPYVHHVRVADFCIRHGRPMVTTSYVSRAMKDRHEQAGDAGIIVLNEIGLDPGIDHMSAMKIIHGVRGRGGRIVSFKSYCGGLPAPEANTNPLGYKFSWSPRGVLLAAKNPARYLEEGREVNVHREDLFNHYHLLEMPGVGTFEAYPNRDSIPYIDLYGLKDCRTMSRWTLRNVSHCATWKQIVDMDLLSEEEMDLGGMSYKDFIMKMSGGAPGKSPHEAVRGRLGLGEWSMTVRKLEWLGLFSDRPIPMERAAPIDVVAGIMLEKMRYEPGERDMIVLHHDFVAELPGGRERITSTMVDHGIPNGDSSMSRTVSLPAAIAAALILDGRIKTRGVAIPVLPEIYEPVLEELKNLGIECREEVTPLDS